MREIQLSKGQLTLVDDEDYEWLSQYKWYLRGRSNSYAVRDIYIGNGKDFHQSMHREIMQVTDPKIEVDHRNRNGLDNQRSNLRVATRIQNAQNVGPRKGNSSGYKGVGWDKSQRKWKAGIRSNGKSKYLGSYNDPVLAAKAYDRAARELFDPEFAYLNFPDDMGDRPRWRTSGGDPDLKPARAVDQTG